MAEREERGGEPGAGNTASGADQPQAGTSLGEAPEASSVPAQPPVTPDAPAQETAQDATNELADAAAQAKDAQQDTRSLERAEAQGSLDRPEGAPSAEPAADLRDTAQRDTLNLGQAPSAPQDAAGDTLPHPTPTTPMPRTQDDPGQEPPTLRDVTRTAGSFARNRFSALQVFLRGHTPVTIGICVAIALATLLVVLFVSHLADLPPEELIEQDMRTHFARSSYEPGPYGRDDPLAVSEVRILERHRTSNQDTCSAQVEVDLANGAVSCYEQLALTYERAEGTWRCSNISEPESLAYTATAGIDTAKAVEGIGLILSRADDAAEKGDPNAVSLPTLYAGADVEVTSERFDPEAQDELVSFHLSRSSAFTSYACDLSARFVFRPGNGMWELASASVGTGAREVKLAPLVGTWRATFVSQQSTGSKCFGAKTAETAIVIESADAEHVSGTVTGLAHYHSDVGADVGETAGDTAFADVRFTGTRDTKSSGISYVCQTPEDEKGSLRLRIDFGTPEDPNAAKASVITTASYESTFIIFPYEREARFQDEFALSKE